MTRIDVQTNLRIGDSFADVCAVPGRVRVGSDPLSGAAHHDAVEILRRANRIISRNHRPSSAADHDLARRESWPPPRPLAPGQIDRDAPLWIAYTAATFAERSMIVRPGFLHTRRSLERRQFVGSLLGAAIGVSLGLLLLAVPARARAGGPADPPFNEQIVFLYYQDIAVADRFFGEAVGLKKTMDQDWVKIYQTGPGSSVGAVKEGRGFLKAAPAKPVMVSWVVDDADTWYRDLKAKNVKILREPRANADSGVKSFVFEDPTGYTFEIMQWLKR
jgi:lactoylglutathione lyase